MFLSQANEDNPVQDWLSQPEEGRLAIDVFRDRDTLVIRTPIAGVEVDDLDIAVDGDLLTIRGKRQAPSPLHEEDWFYRECYWGPFSRSVILPIDVIPNEVQASLKQGILDIRLPIREQGRAITIRPTLLD
jgi:HSP20 family protein